MSEITLGYWGIRGRGQIPRHLLAYSGLPFTEKVYKAFEEYAGEKFNLGIDFPNLPYLIDGDVKISETWAVCRYILKKSGKNQLIGKTPQDELIIQSFITVFFEELIVGFIKLFFDKKMNDLKTPHLYKIKGKLDKFEKFLSGKQWAIGYLSLLDFAIAEGSFYLEKLYPEEYNKKYVNIKRIREAIHELPEIKAYYERQVHVLTPFLPPNLTPQPFFFPGTEPKIPPPPTLTESKSSKSDSAVKSAPVDYKPEQPIKLLLISGSLEEESPTNSLLKALVNCNHSAFNVSWGDISLLEIHREGIDEQGTQNVNNLRQQAEQSTGILIGVTQTHKGISVALANAYNWLSPVLRKKPVGLISVGNNQNRFRATLDEEGIKYLKNPILNIPKIEEVLDGQGNVQQAHQNRVKNYLNGLALFIDKNK